MKDELKGRQFNMEENVQNRGGYKTDNGTDFLGDFSLKAIFNQTELSSPLNLLERVEEGHDAFSVNALNCQSAQSMLEDYADGVLDEVNSFLICEHISMCEKCAIALENIELLRTIFAKTAVDAPKKIAEIVYANVTAELDSVTSSAQIFKKTEVNPVGVSEKLYERIELELAKDQELSAMFRGTEVTPPQEIVAKVFNEKRTKRPNVLYLRILKTASVAAMFAIAVLGANKLIHKAPNIDKSPNTTASAPADITGTEELIIIGGDVVAVAPQSTNNTSAKPSNNKNNNMQEQEKAPAQKNSRVITVATAKPTEKRTPSTTATAQKSTATPQISVNKTVRQKDTTPTTSDRVTAATVHREDRSTVVASSAKDKFNSSTNVVKVSSADDAQARYAEEANKELAKGVDKSQYLL